MGEQQPELPQEEEQRDLADSGSKRKLEDTIELAKQKAQEIAARLVGDADNKRPRLASETATATSLSSNFHNPVSYSAPPTYPVTYAAQPSLNIGTSKIISIPNGKVGVVIGKGGETIKYIQLQSGARIQITKDQEADPHALTRDVELTGTSEQINRAEQLINDVIAEADVGSSGTNTAQTTQQSGGEQIALKVPNDKVGLLIGKGGETIKFMQSKSGARMQIIPLHLPPGDISSERTVYINGSKEQVDAATDLVNDVVSGKRILIPSMPNTYAQPMYASGGTWAQQGQPPIQQQPQYGYTQPGLYYSNYSAQQPTWDQSNLSQTSQPMAGYGYYGQQSQVGSAPLNSSYGYSQTPVASTGYDQGYSQQPASYAPTVSAPGATMEQQNPYLASQPDGTIASQSTQTGTAYPPAAYSQPTADPQAYWTASGYSYQHAAQTSYDQTVYSQAAYGQVQTTQVPSPSTQPVYGQAGYPQPTDNYAQGTYGVSYEQPQPDTLQQSQPASNGPSQSEVYGADKADDKNLNSNNGSNAAQEAVSSQS